MKIIFHCIFIYISTYSLCVYPGIIDKEIVKNKFSKKLSEDFDLNFNLDTNVSYRIFPEPHFFFSNVVISKKNEFGKIKILEF